MWWYNRAAKLQRLRNQWGGGSAPVGGTSSLYTNLVAYWPLDEASGTRINSIGDDDLQDGNTVTQNTGVVGSAAEFTPANTEYLQCVDSAALSMGDVDMAISCWFYITAEDAIRIVLSKFASTGTTEYRIYYNNSSDKMVFEVSGDGTATTTAQHGTNVTGSTWTHIFAWHDAVNNQIGINMNNGTAVTQSHTTGIFDGTNNFRVGTRANGGQYWSGRIDEIAIWKNYIPTVAERTWLFNAGSGRSFSDLFNYTG